MIEDNENLPRCPQCGEPMQQVETADYCTNCDYEVNYP